MALNDRQALFVEEYLRTFNATKAALSAGYSPRSACEIGWENLRKPQIAEVIKQRLAESAMSADEVLMRLADIARGDIADLLKVDGNNIKIDLDKAMVAQKTGLIKKLTQKTTTRTTDDVETEDVVTSIELHDPLTALQLIGKNHKLFVEKAEVSGPNGGPIEYKDVNEASKRILGKLDKLASRIRTDSSAERTSTNGEGQGSS